MVTKDTIKFDTIPINPQNFRVLNRQKKILYPTEYTSFIQQSSFNY